MFTVGFGSLLENIQKDEPAFEPFFRKEETSHSSFVSGDDLGGPSPAGGATANMFESQATQQNLHSVLRCAARQAALLLLSLLSAVKKNPLELCQCVEKVIQLLKDVHRGGGGSKANSQPLKQLLCYALM